MISTNITMDFLKRLRSLPSWAEMAYAFDNRFIPVKTIIDYAIDKVLSNENPNDIEISIASSSVDDSITDFVHSISDGERDPTEHSIKLHWANILLAWAYENRASFDDFLGVVENIYADFDYPEELAPFVRYMPSEAPNLGSREANEERIIKSINDYIQQFLIS